MNMQKLRDPQAWIYLLAFVKVVFAVAGVHIAPEKWAQLEELVNAAASVAVAFGIFKYNPNKGVDSNGN